MQLAKPGIAKAGVNQYWSVVDPKGNSVSEFDILLFDFIPEDVDVYYVDLDLNHLCENVQVRDNVDERVQMASPQNGFTREAQEVLVDYIMDALKVALLSKASADQTRYLDSLDDKMQLVRSEAMADPSRKVSVPLLKRVLQR